MTSVEKLERKKPSSASKLSRTSLDRRSKTSSGSRKSASKKTSTDFVEPENLPKENINYANEIVLIFYDSLLKGIVDEWQPIVVEPVKSDPGDEEVKVKDFKELTSDDLTKSQVVAVKGSQVSLTKKRGSSSLNGGKSSSRDKFKTKQLTEGDNTSIGSKAKRKSSEKIERPKRSSRSMLSGSLSSATLTTIKSEEIVTVNDSKEWLLKTEDENVVITFKNGNIYEGGIHKKTMHGVGKFWWADGVYYEGDFKNGDITGKGKMILSDLSYYEGEFYEGLFHGNGVFCISSSPMVYSGGWKAGKKHGKGWLLYEPNNWYDGEWFEGKRQGFGIRHYVSGAVYEGMWWNNIQNGEGSMAWENSDFYKGEWKDGAPHGYGEYTWSAFFNATLTFPLLNTYQGSWVDGMRNGIGLMHFGTQGGAKLAGVWKDNLKHGPGILVCGNGHQIHNDPLFLNDKPIHLDLTPSARTTLTRTMSREKKSDMRRRSSLQVASRQIALKQSSRKFENIDLKLRKEPQPDKCNPLDIPLHSVPEQVTFEHYIVNVLETLRVYSGSVCETFVFGAISNETYENYSKTLNTSKWNILTTTEPPSQTGKMGESAISRITFPITNNLSKMQYIDFSRYLTEEKQLRNCVTQNLRKLTEIYYKYATICSQEPINFKPVMVRLYLWQLWRDLGIVDEITSIYEIDLMLNENPHSGYETIHCPFEKIYFWQFLQALVAISWYLCLKRNEVILEEDGIVANCFRKFLEEFILEHRLHVRAYSLFEFRDLLPIKDVYRLYCKLGEPHTARDFLKATCVTKGAEPPCYLKTSNQTLKLSTRRGFNAVPVGFNIMFLPEETEEYQPIESVEYEDPFFKDLITFRRLGIKTIVQCLADVCPQICQDGTVVMIDYPLSFLEFYEVLLLCAYKLVDRKLKQKEALEEQARLEQQSNVTLTDLEHVTIVTSERKIRRGSKEKDKKRARTK